MTPHLPSLYTHQLETADDLRKALDPRMWGWLVQLLKTSRSYEAGLAGARLLQQQIETFASELHPEELNTFRHQAYALELVMLDKLDRLDEYLERWQWMRENIGCELEYSLPVDYSAEWLENSRNEARLPASGFVDAALPAQLTNLPVREDQRPFVLRYAGESVWLHWLYQHEDRRQVIIRKLERKRKGKPRKSDQHGTAADISPEVMQERLNDFQRAIEQAWSNQG